MTGNSFGECSDGIPSQIPNPARRLLLQQRLKNKDISWVKLSHMGIEYFILEALTQADSSPVRLIQTTKSMAAVRTIHPGRFSTWSYSKEPEFLWSIPMSLTDDNQMGASNSLGGTSLVTATGLGSSNEVYLILNPENLTEEAKRQVVPEGNILLGGPGEVAFALARHVLQSLLRLSERVGLHALTWIDKSDVEQAEIYKSGGVIDLRQERLNQFRDMLHQLTDLSYLMVDIMLFTALPYYPILQYVPNSIARKYIKQAARRRRGGFRHSTKLSFGHRVGVGKVTLIASNTKSREMFNDEPRSSRSRRFRERGLTHRLLMRRKDLHFYVTLLEQLGALCSGLGVVNTVWDHRYYFKIGLLRAAASQTRPALTALAIASKIGRRSEGLTNRSRVVSCMEIGRCGGLKKDQGDYSATGEAVSSVRLADSEDTAFIADMMRAKLYILYLEEYEPAIQICEEWLSHNTVLNSDYDNLKHARCRLLLGAAQLRHGKQAVEALENLIRSCELDRLNWQSWLWLSHALAINEDFSQALKSVRISLKLNPGELSSWLTLAAISGVSQIYNVNSDFPHLISTDTYNKGIVTVLRELDRGLTVYPTNIVLLYYKMICYLSLTQAYDPGRLLKLCSEDPPEPLTQSASAPFGSRESLLAFVQEEGTEMNDDDDDDTSSDLTFLQGALLIFDYLVLWMIGEDPSKAASVPGQMTEISGLARIDALTPVELYEIASEPGWTGTQVVHQTKGGRSDNILHDELSVGAKIRAEMSIRGPAQATGPGSLGFLYPMPEDFAITAPSEYASVLLPPMLQQIITLPQLLTTLATMLGHMGSAPLMLQVLHRLRKVLSAYDTKATSEDWRLYDVATGHYDLIRGGCGGARLRGAMLKNMHCPHTLILKACSLFRSKQTEMGVQLLNEALELDPQNETVRRFLADYYAAASQYSKSAQLLSDKRAAPALIINLTSIPLFL